MVRFMGASRRHWDSWRLFLEGDIRELRRTPAMTEKDFQAANLIIDELGSSEAVYFIARQIEEKAAAGEIGGMIMWKRILRAASKLIVSGSLNSLH